MDLPPRRFERRPHGHPKSRASRRSPTLESLPPRLRSLVEAAVLCHGDAEAMLRCLALQPRTLHQRLSILRRLGLVRAVYLVDPRKRGRPLECLTLVRLARHSRDAMADFEAWCVADPWVTCAARVCGRFDYQLTSFHADLREANRWRRVLEARSEIQKVDQRGVRTLAGHPLSGMPLVSKNPNP